MNDRVATTNDAASHEQRDAEADLVVAMLERYGLDGRARSALKAYFHHDPHAGAQARRVEALDAVLAGPETEEIRAASSYRVFLDLFAGLPEADFSPHWIEQLAIAWSALRLAGAETSWCLRAANGLAAHASRELLAGRQSLSPLEIEILSALTAAGFCLADFLIELTAVRGTELVAESQAEGGEGRFLSGYVGAALAGNTTTIVGLLILHLRVGPGTLALDRLQREALWNAAVTRVRTLLREGDLLVRTEAHSCAIILPNLKTHAQAVLAANKVARVLELPLPVMGTIIRASFSVGAVWSPEHGHSADDLIRCGELAVEEATRSDRSVVLFDQTMLSSARQEARLETELVLALEGGHLSIHVQPQIDLATGKCIGGEVLLRWTASDGTQVPPARMIEVARRTGTGPQLTRWLLFSVCRTLAELTRADIDFRLSVNLMARDIMDHELPLLIEQASNFWRVSASRLTVELVESAMLEDPEGAATVMFRLLNLGVTTSIDDFGIGYSSILYLRQLPLRELKVDCVFVSPMARSRQDHDIVEALISLAHGLGLRVVAEGVEDEATYALLKSMGCDRAQGYWIARAMPVDELATWVTNWNQRQSAS